MGNAAAHRRSVTRCMRPRAPPPLLPACPGPGSMQFMNVLASWTAHSLRQVSPHTTRSHSQGLLRSPRPPRDFPDPGRHLQTPLSRPSLDT